jgi:antitoxin PrlF
MITLTTTERGQLTIRKEVLRHLGIEAGGKIELDLLPNGKVEMRAPQRKGTIQDFLGSLSTKSTKIASLEEIKEATEKSWSGQR